MTEKSLLRQSARAKRHAITSADRAAWTAAIHQNLRALLQSSLREPCIIAAYCAVRGELEILPALEPLSARHTIALPVLMEGSRDIRFCRYRFGDALVEGRYGIPEPPPPPDILIPDVVISPMLAFDTRFHRLGYGAGYYDRSLRELRTANPRLIVAGVAFALQETPSVYASDRDEILDWIVTEKGIIIRP